VDSVNLPVDIGKLEIGNRFVLPPMVTKFATREGEVTEQMVRYYSARSLGGAGLIIVEAANVSPEGKLLDTQLEVGDDRCIQGLERLSMAIKKEGARAFIQLAHGGARAEVSRLGGFEVVSASPVSVDEVPDPPWSIPKPLSRKGIKEMVQSFIRAASRAYEAGFDGIEVHCAHLYFLSQFLSPRTNKRKDEYGTKRTRIVEEIVQGIKGSVDKDFPVICRINGIEEMQGGVSLKDARENARSLEEGGADGIHVSAFVMPGVGIQGSGKLISEPGKLLSEPESSFKDCPFVPYAENVRSAVKIPVIAVGKIMTLGQAERIIAEGAADMIAVGRGQLADPHLVRKWLEGRSDEVNKCTVCGRCSRELGKINCPVNPGLGTENEVK